MLAQFKTGWEAQHPRNAGGYPAIATDPLYVPYAFEEETLDTTQLGALGAWMDLTIKHTSSSRLTQGLKKYERLGFIFVRAFGPKGQGIACVTTLVDDIRTALESKEIVVGSERVLTYEGRTTDVTDPAWSAKGVTIRFRYTETR